MTRFSSIIARAAICFLFGLFLGCKTPLIMFPPPVLELNDCLPFCALTAHKGELVYARCSYSKVNGNWCLHAEDTSCNAITANLYLANSDMLKPEYLKLFKAVNREDVKSYLVIDAIGTFENDTSGYEHGIGDLGTNHYRFVVKEVVAIQKRPAVR